jgi:hypothetical protein
MTATYKLAEATLFPGGQLQPWRSVHVPWQAFPITSMICDDEVRFLHYLTSHHYTAAGSVVDMGPLAGGSTYAMAAGMRRGRIHSYDLWTYFEGFDAYFGHMPLSADLLPAFKRNTSEFAHLIVPHQGNILEQRWSAGPIEIMFIDAAKTPALMFHIVNEFFPNLRRGAYVIHQDFVSAEDPWIHVAMGLLAPHFEVMDSPDGGSVCFRVIEPIPSTPLSVDFLDGQRHLIKAARRLLPGWHGLCLELAEANYLALTGSPGEAKDIVDAVRRHELYEPQRFAYDIQLVQRAIEHSGPRR